MDWILGDDNMVVDLSDLKSRNAWGWVQVHVKVVLKLRKKNWVKVNSTSTLTTAGAAITHNPQYHVFQQPLYIMLAGSTLNVNSNLNS